MQQKSTISPETIVTDNNLKDCRRHLELKATLHVDSAKPHGNIK